MLGLRLPVETVPSDDIRSQVCKGIRVCNKEGGSSILVDLPDFAEARGCG